MNGSRIDSDMLQNDVCRAGLRVRRRCRSEGLERSPYDYYQVETQLIMQEEASAQRHRSKFNMLAEHTSPQEICKFTPSLMQINGVEATLHNNHNEYTNFENSQRYTSPVRSARHPSPLHHDCLPRVEEIYEKADLMDFSVDEKQPLKSIMNNPRTSPPPAIKKKCKEKQDKPSSEGRRRQRAMSESEYNYVHYDSKISQESRVQSTLSYMKRMKDNSGSAYGAGCDACKRRPGPLSLPPSERTAKAEHRLQEGNILRTTAIRRERSVSPSRLPPVPAAPSPPPCTSPRLLTTSKIALKKRKKIKGKKMKTKKLPEGEDEDGSPTPSPCEMEVEGDACDADVRQLSDKLTDGAVVSAAVAPSIATPYDLSACMRTSLFPRVPPYYKFINYDQLPALKPPPSIGKHLKWKVTTITPIVVKKTLMSSGFRLVRSECDTSECPQEETVEWIGIWGKHMKSLMFRAIKDGQKMNHFPGTFQIGRKDRLWRNLQKLCVKYGIKEFGIMPKTYVLPHDMKLLKRDWEKYAARNEKWIIKPPASARGSGIAVVSRWSEIPKKRSLVVQRYIAKPYLINGSKFDLRLYVLVTSMHPIKIYLYSDGLARFASVKYTEDAATLHDRYMHLTNYSINRLSKNYTSNEDAAACQGHKWTLQTLMQYLERERGVDTTALWQRLKDLVIKTIISGESTIRSLTEANITSRYNCYELFGIDVLLDENLKPWLLEVNISPSLHSSSPLDLHVKAPLVTTVLNIAQFHLPNKTGKAGAKTSKYANMMYDPRLYTVYLSKEERDKHMIYTKTEDRDEYLTGILSTLTPDDVRHLLQAEDELAACRAHSPHMTNGNTNGDVSTATMDRIFPTADTHHYLDYLAAPRYYNRLFDAWENKYQRDRTQGINMLRSLCEIGYHLEVPPVPMKSEASVTSVSVDVVAAPSAAAEGARRDAPSAAVARV